MKNKDRANFIWNVLGSFSSALVSVVLLWLVSRLLPLSEADIFSFAYSFGNLMVIIGLFQVRNFQATDLKQEYSFASYILLRLMTATSMLLLSGLYLGMSQLSGGKKEIVFLVVCFRLADVFSDVFQGFYQQHNRLDKAGQYLTYRNILSLILFGLGLWWSQDLLVSLILLTVFSLLYVFSYDVRGSFAINSWRFSEIWSKKTRQQAWRIFLATAPLFINGFILLYIYNNPKYVLDTLLERKIVAEGMQTYFNVLFMPAFVMNLLMLFFRPHLTQMADAYRSGQMSVFNRIQSKILIYLSLASFLILGVSWFVGISFLEKVYVLSLRQYQKAFFLLMLGGVVGSFATAFDNFLTILRKQRLLLISYIVSLLVSLSITEPLVKWGILEGAALSYFLIMLVWLILSLVIYAYVKIQLKEELNGD